MARKSSGPRSTQSAGRSRGGKTTRRKSAAKRTVVSPNGNKRYVRRNRKGQFKRVVDMGKSLSTDRRSKSNTKVAKGQGDRGDR
jgi:hypothetical protein